jgi:hypothetical protein
MLRPGILLASLPDGTFTTELADDESLRSSVGYDYMNARLIHDQTLTGCSDSLMGCTQDDKMDTGWANSRMSVAASLRSERRDDRGVDKVSEGVSPGGKQTVRPSGGLKTLAEMQVQTVR